ARPARPAAGLVQEPALPLAGGRRSARSSGGVRGRACGRRRAARGGFDVGRSVPRAATPTGRHRGNERGRAGGARHARLDDRRRTAGVARGGIVDADAVELRVLGCLIEKQRTTPDQYPLSLNALRLACNQTTNRDPVVDYDEPTIRDALTRLSNRGWARLASGPGPRAVKYPPPVADALSPAHDEISLLAA